MSETLVVREGRGDELPIFIHSDLDDLPLTTEAFRVYAHLARRAGKYGEAWPSYASIGEVCFRKTYPKASGDTLRRKAIAAVNELLGMGLINKEANTKEDGSRSSNSYILTKRSEWGGGVNALPSVNALGVVSPHQGSVTAPKDNPYEYPPSLKKKDDDDDDARLRGAVIKAWEEQIGVITQKDGVLLNKLIVEYGATNVIRAIGIAKEKGGRTARYVEVTLQNEEKDREKQEAKHRNSATNKRSYQPDDMGRKTGYSAQAEYYLNNPGRTQEAATAGKYSQWNEYAGEGAR